MRSSIFTIFHPLDFATGFAILPMCFLDGGGDGDGDAAFSTDSLSFREDRVTRVGTSVSATSFGAFFELARVVLFGLVVDLSFRSAGLDPLVSGVVETTDWALFSPLVFGVLGFAATDDAALRFGAMMRSLQPL